MKNKDVENIEPLKRESFLNNYLTQKVNSLADPVKRFHFVRKTFIILALVISSQILDTFNNILLFLSLVYIVFEFGYKIDQKYKILGTIFFVMRLLCGMYFGYALSLSLSFAGKNSNYFFNDYFKPEIMINEYSSENYLLLIGIVSGLIIAFLLDILISHHKKTY